LRTLRPRGSFVLYGAASGPVPPIDPLRFMAAGSVFFSRPTFAHFARTHAELQERAADVFAAMNEGALEIRIAARYPLAEAAQAHRDLEARVLTGKAILIP
jgi:NADPH2:quinone reductase